MIEMSCRREGLHLVRLTIKLVPTSFRYLATAEDDVYLVHCNADSNPLPARTSPTGSDPAGSAFSQSSLTYLRSTVDSVCSRLCPVLALSGALFEFQGLSYAVIFTSQGRQTQSVKPYLTD